MALDGEKSSGVDPAADVAFLNDSPWMSIDSLRENLAALVGIDSVNPSFGGPPGGERRAMEWAAQFLGHLGLESRLIERIPERPFLRARLEGESSRAVLYQTHLDTVSTKSMSIDPFAGTVQDGRLWGRGATDAKGQAIAMLHAMAAWRESGRKPPQSIELALVPDEEYSMQGAAALLADGIDVEGIVIGEPTQLRVVTTHKGCVRWLVHVTGRAAHAAHPEQGINAIYKAAHFLRAIERQYIPELNHRNAALLSAPTINVGLIKGGIQDNLVPPECRVALERRLIPGETEASARAEIEALIEELAAKDKEFKAELSPATFAASAVETTGETALVRVAGAMAVAFGREGTPIGVDYCTDASVLSEAGRPIVIVGPGSIEQAHTADEFIELEALQEGARFYAVMMGQTITN